MATPTLRRLRRISTTRPPTPIRTWALTVSTSRVENTRQRWRARRVTWFPSIATTLGTWTPIGPPSCVSPGVRRPRVTRRATRTDPAPARTVTRVRGLRALSRRGTPSGRWIVALATACRRPPHTRRDRIARRATDPSPVRIKRLRPRIGTPTARSTSTRLAVTPAMAPRPTPLRRVTSTIELRLPS